MNQNKGKADSTVFRTSSKKMQPFPRTRPYTEVKDSHVRYYAMHDRAPKEAKVAFKDTAGRRYRMGPVVPGGLQRLYVKLPKGGTWFTRTGQQLDLHPVGNAVVLLTPTLAYAFLGGGARRSGYVDVRNWWWDGK